jgi:uncharacterized protein YlxW (UPF0749 family)
MTLSEQIAELSERVDEAAKTGKTDVAELRTAYKKLREYAAAVGAQPEDLDGLDVIEADLNSIQPEP